MAVSSVSSSVALPSSYSRHLRRSRRPSFSIPGSSSAKITPLLAGFSGNSRRRVLAVAPFCLGEVLSKKMATETAASAGNGSELGKGKPELLVFATEEELSDSLARYTAELSKKFAQERGAFSIVVSGGSLIKSLRKLAESPHVESVDWNKWHVFWVDERVVPKDHADSNYKLAYDGLLSKVPIPPGQIYAINDSLSAEGAAEDYETCMKQLVKTSILGFSTASGFPKFDLMLLGMGPDGHVASLFPDHPLLQENSRWVTFIKDSPKPPPERITFTFPVINSSSNIALVATGAGKADPVQRALGAGSTSSDKLPIEMVSLMDGKLTWFADKEAASKLETSASL